MGCELRHNHVFTLAFSVESNDVLGRDITSKDFTAAVQKRLLDINKNFEWYEAVGDPYDTYEVQE